MNQDLTVCADSVRCEECGKEDQLCCPSLLPEMTNGVCDAGMGCTNDVELAFERKCKPCGTKGGPCCWDVQHGYTCANEMHCSGAVGGVISCSVVFAISGDCRPKYIGTDCLLHLQMTRFVADHFHAERSFW